MQLELQDVYRHFGSVRALDGVTLSVPDDVRTLTLIGPSGGGKSTFLRVVAGLQEPDRGTVSVNGEVVSYTSRALLRHRRANGYVFQSFNLFPHLSALRNITLPLERVHGKAPGEAREIAEACLERFHLKDHQHKHPAQMSGGQQQRVAIARAIAPEPGLLILDEPTSALDPEMTAGVLDLIEQLVEEGQQIILSTHEMGFARAVSDEVVFLAEGKALVAGSSEEVFDNKPMPELERFLGKVMRY